MVYKLEVQTLIFIFCFSPWMIAEPSPIIMSPTFALLGAFAWTTDTIHAVTAFLDKSHAKQSIT